MNSHMMLITYISTLTFVHVLLSLIGIGSGFVVLFGLLARRRLDRWTAIFLSTTVATSATGFFFPIHKLTPGLVIGIISLVVLALAIMALYVSHLAGAWRWIYVFGSVFALYLNVFVAIAQAFRNIPALREMATQSESPFRFTQLTVVTLFIVLAIVAAKRFRVAHA